MKKTDVHLIAIFCFSLMLACNKSGEHFSIYSVNGSVKVNNAESFAGMVLVEGDRIECDSKSFSIVQFGKKGFILIYPSTIARISVKGENAENIILDKGAAFVNISDGEFSILSSGVQMKSKGRFKGVVFSAGSVMSVHLASGEIQLVYSGDDHSSNKAANLKPGYYIDFIDGMMQSPIPLSETSIREQMIFDRINIYAGSPVSPNEILHDDARQLVLSFDQNKVADLAALKRLAIKYGPLSIVKTRNGRTFIGAVKVQGRTMEIETTEGTIRILSSEMKTSSRY